LKILRLGQNGIGGEDGIAELQEALSENDTLEELYLDQNNLENLGAGVLANFLVNNSTLRVLDLTKNKIGS
jgi:Ran GTPase-activating protein (RanGAP) involved in mRNA processing and transport